MKKAGLSVEEHFQYGKELFDFRNKLVSFAVLVGNAYPIKSQQVRSVNAALNAVDKLRSEMDNAIYSEVPTSSSVNPIKAYYPGKDS